MIKMKKVKQLKFKRQEEALHGTNQPQQLCAPLGFSHVRPQSHVFIVFSEARRVGGHLTSEVGENIQMAGVTAEKAFFFDPAKVL